MFRWGALRVGPAVGGATGVAATVATASESHARVRPSRFVRPNENGRGAASDQCTEDGDDWLPFSLDGDEVVFGRDEVKESIEDVLNIAQARRMESSTDTESVESFGADADALIEHAGASSSTGGGQVANMQTLATFTEKLLSRPSIQKELLDAIRDDDEMKNMFGQLAGPRAAEMQVLHYPPRMALPGIEIEDVTEDASRHQMNPFDVIIRDIGQGLEAAGAFLGKIGRWVKSKVNREPEAQREPGEPLLIEEELTAGEKVLGSVLCLAGVVMVFMVAKRVGVLRVLHSAVQKAAR